MWIGAWVLAFIAGMVNVVGLMSFEHEALTHMTGLTSRLAQGIGEGNAADVSTVWIVMTSFVGGAALSGVLIRDSALEWGRRYGVALLIEAGMLCVAAMLINHHDVAGFSCAAFACGLQNAMASNFSGSTLRTTHVSGMFTDLGLSIGHRLRGVEVDVHRLRICVSTITGFAAGGVACVFLFKHLAAKTLFVPAGLALALAVIYQVFLRRRGNLQNITGLGELNPNQFRV